jgi:hypothetical protein
MASLDGWRDASRVGAQRTGVVLLDLSNTLTTVPVQIRGAAFSAGTPVRVFATRYATPVGFRTYDPSPDGQRFLIIKEDQNATVASMVVVLNWSEELKQRVPMK